MMVGSEVLNKDKSRAGIICLHSGCTLVGSPVINCVIIIPISVCNDNEEVTEMCVHTNDHKHMTLAIILCLPVY